MKTAVKRIAKDFRAFLSVYGKIAKRLGRCTECEEVVDLLDNALSDDALRLVIYCCQSEGKCQVRAVILDDIGDTATTEFKKLERVLARVRETKCQTALGDAYRRRVNGKGLIPDKNVVEEFEIECGIVMPEGEAFGRLAFRGVEHEIYCIQQSLPNLTLTAARIIDRIDDAYDSFVGLGVDVPQLRSHEQQLDAFITVLRVVKGSSQRLGFEWNEMLETLEKDS